MCTWAIRYPEMALKRGRARQVAEQMALMEGLRALNPQLQAEVRTPILPGSEPRAHHDCESF